MKVKKIIIHNFKSIAGNCIIEVAEKVTTMVGASQSGKTNVLRAIQKFTTGDYQPDDICDFSKAGSETKPDHNMPMISITFYIEKHDEEALREISPMLVSANELTMTRKYDGEYQIDAPSIDLGDDELSVIYKKTKAITDQFDSFLHKCKEEWTDIDNEISEASQKLDDFKTLTNSLAQTKAGAVSQPLLPALEPMRQALNPLLEILEQEKEAPVEENEPQEQVNEATAQAGSETIDWSIEANQARQLISELEALAKQHDDITASPREVVPKLVNLLPAFIYVGAEHDTLLQGTVNLDELESSPEDDAKFGSARRLIKLADLNLATLPNNYLQRRNFFNNASDRLTEVLQRIWQQQRIEIELSLGGPSERQLSILISSDGRPKRFPEHQGLGFRWYLEFYLSYAMAAGKELKNDVLLLDEAGIHLHPYAQRNLVDSLKEIAEHNQIIHATHLPDMLDLENPETWRVVIHEEGSAVGTQIINRAYQPKEESIGFEVVTKALWGSVIVPAITLGPRNLIVEGASDAIYLLAISRILGQDDADLAFLTTGEVVTFPAHGLSRCRTLLTFCNRPGFNTVALFDSDAAGKRKKQQLISDGILSSNKAVEINDVYSSAAEERDLENLFGFTLEKEATMHVYHADLPAGFDFKLDDLPRKGGLGRKLKDFIESQGIGLYDKTKVAESVKKILALEPGKLSQSNRDRLAELLRKIKTAFQDEDQ